VSAPAYRRLENDERRRRLLELGARLFTEHAYDEISMAQIARAAGISKALLYHYFPSKQDYFVATRAGGAEELRAHVEPDPSLPPAQALAAAVDAYLEWIEHNAAAYEKLLRSAGTVPDVRELVDGVRTATADRILEGLDISPTLGRESRSAAGCGSWTAPAWTGSRTATSRAQRSTGCCSGRWPARCRRPEPKCRRPDYAGEPGSVMTKRAPPSSGPSSRTLPPCASATCRTIARPSPEPGRPRAVAPR
jgi:AcrR family transcriptional regulator